MTKLSQIIDTDAVYQAAVKQLKADETNQSPVGAKAWPQWVSSIHTELTPLAATALPTGPR